MAATGLVIGAAAFLSTPGARATAPPVGADCAAATHTRFANNTSTPLPDATTTPSNINVAGVGTFLRDVDLKTNIQHAFPTDLDIRLISPAGTVSTISTDNGGSATNAFNGIVWDDTADPGNNGPVTDSTFAANVTNSPLVPEEALGAFVGENPNGTWTLSVGDDFAPDPGTLNGWRLDLQTLPGPPANLRGFAANSAPGAAINDNSATNTSLTVAGAGANIGDINLTTDITHGFPGDLDVRLTSPAGTISTITTDNGSGNDNVFAGTTWDDRGDLADEGAISDRAFANAVIETPAVPEEAMGAFTGENPNGTWTLTVFDDAGGDTGTVDSWGLSGSTICTPAPASPPPADTPPPVDGGETPGQLPTVSIRDAKAKEPNKKTATVDIAVVLSGPSDQQVEVSFATKKGTAKPKSDFKPKTGSLVFGPGETEKEIPVKIVGDKRSEGKEKFSVKLSGPTNATIGDSAGKVTIKKSD